MIERLLPAGPGRVARVRWTDRHDGDFRVDGPGEELERARQQLASGPWTWLRQVHGSRVVDVGEPGQGAGTEADASVTSVCGAVLSVQSADCAPVVLVGDGAVAIAHAGWRGIVSGVVPAVVDALRAHVDGSVRAVIGPVVRPAHYEFGERELSEVAAVVGEEVRASTEDGRPALDLAAAVTAALRRSGVDETSDLGLDTSGDSYFSHRCRHEVGRQVAIVVMEQR